MTTSISSLPTHELVAKFPAKDADHPWILASNRIEIDSMTAWHDDFFNGDQQIIERFQAPQCIDISWLVTIYTIFISNTRPRHNERYLLGPIFRNQCKSTTFHMLYKHILIISTLFLTQAFIRESSDSVPTAFSESEWRGSIQNVVNTTKPSLGATKDVASSFLSQTPIQEMNVV